MEEHLFRNHDGRESRIKITDEKPIGAGALGEVASVDAEVAGKEGRFVIKRYQSVLGKERAAKAFENYRMAKEAGLRVFPTFRLGEDGTSILMTTAHTEEWICVSSNSEDTSDVEQYGVEKLKTIPRIDAYMREIFDESLKAAEKGIWIDQDAFFFLVKRSGEAVDFVIGDFDLMRKKEIDSEDARNNVFAENLYSAKKALQSFFETNVVKKMSERYSKQAKETWISLMKERNIPFIHVIN
jgi:hypothetical protein